ncbi:MULTISPECIES: MFS transporter [Tsukamurella]|uniref:MFS transporter n=1 Tax=Tsukamurella TaxID=2060 RepID=UPI001E527F8E|nr:MULTISPECIES: MFS transporter [Tsukamurella]
MTDMLRKTRAGAPSDGILIAVLCLGGLLASLMQSLVVPLVGQLPHLLDTTADNASWVITSTLLASSVAMPIAGRLGDMYGKRLILLTSLLSLIAGSLICALSHTLLLTVVGRSFQGFAMGLVPVGISLMRDELHARKIPGAVALMSAMLGVGGAIGIPFGAYISEHFDYHTLFWFSLALGVITLGLVYVVVPESPNLNPGKFDVVGTVGLSVGLVSVLLSITKGQSWGWTSAATIGCAIGGAGVLVLWGWWELRTQESLVDLRISARRPILLTNLASIMVGFAMFSLMLTMPQLLQIPEATGYGLGLTMLNAGLWMVPGGLVMMALSPVSALLTKRIGARLTLAIGAAMSAIGYFSLLGLTDATWKMSLGSMIVFGGVGVAYSAMPALIMGNVPETESAAANGLNSLMRSMGTAVASAVMATVLTRSTITLGAGTPRAVELPAESAFTTSFVIAGVVAAVAAVVALAIPRNSATASSEASAPATDSARTEETPPTCARTA